MPTSTKTIENMKLWAFPINGGFTPIMLFYNMYFNYHNAFTINHNPFF